MFTEAMNQKFNTPIVPIGLIEGNQVYMKRDDLIPYSFGGNKARKAFLFFQEIDKGNYDCVVTYGSSHSNHCRIISNMAAARNMPCFIIGPSEVSDSTYNSRFMELFGAEITTVPVDKVHDTIELKLSQLVGEGMKPYFIPGGGHGNIGTEAYVQCYEEIREYELNEGIHFDYIFFASGTGTTHAGLVCGQILHGDSRRIVGISIARKNPRGREIVLDSIREYLPSVDESELQEKTVFLDDFTGDGYSKNDTEVLAVIKEMMLKYGIPMDSTYTAKAFSGAKKYLHNNRIKDKTILFIHTGGTPLFFDDVKKFGGGKLIRPLRRYTPIARRWAA